jgi:hypothetical protein
MRLRDALSDLPALGFVEVPISLYSEPPQGLDAVFLTLPAAERWKHNPLSRRAQILTVPQKDRNAGFPPFIITGVNLAPTDPTDPLSQVRIILEEAIAAIREHNQRNELRIDTLGFWIMTLTSGVTEEELVHLLHTIVATNAVGEI